MKHGTLFLWSVSGFLSGLSLLNAIFWPLSLWALALQFLLLQREEHSRKVLLLATVAGSIHMLVVLSWTWSLVPLVQLGLDGGVLQKAVTGFFWATASLCIGFGYGVVLSGLQYLAAQYSRVLLLLFPVGVLLGEVFGRLIVSLYILPAEGGIDLSYGFGHVGYALAEHGLLLQTAHLGGVYALTFVLASIALGLTLLSRRSTSLCIGVFALIFITQTATIETTIPERIKDVVLVSAYAPLEGRDGDGLSEVLALEHVVEEAAAEGYTEIILPEDSRFFNTHIGVHHDIHIIDTARYDTPNGPRLQTVAYKHDEERTYTHEKQHLVPLGEYVPIAHQALLRLFGLGALADDATSIYGYKPGIEISSDQYAEDLPPVLFCYESAVPYRVKTIDAYGDWPYVAHVVSHSWFADRQDVLKHELSAMLRVQALWSGVFILQSANLAPMAVYSPNGTEYEGPAAHSGQPLIYSSVKSIVAGEE